VKRADILCVLSVNNASSHFSNGNGKLNDMEKLIDNRTMPLKDSYNRRIDYLRVSVTDKCNLKCIYCTPKKNIKHFSGDDILTDDEIVRFIRIAHKNGLRKVRITGGEPLLRKNILPLVASIKEIGIRDLSLTTNGIMLSEMAVELKKAGLDRVNISLDTLDAERYRGITRGGDMTRVWEAIRASEQAGLSPVKINIVPMKGLNDDEILSFASLTMENNFHIRFIEFMPAIGDGSWSKEKYVKSADVLKKISPLGELYPFTFKGNGPSRNFKLRGAIGVIGIISPLSDHFCKYCNRLRLTSNGIIRPCLFSSKEIDIRTPMRSGATDEDIDALFHHAIRIKPQRHLINENTAASTGHLTAMSEIGG